MAISDSDDSVRDRPRVIALALSLLAVELLAGMQTYLSQTVLPLLAGELAGAQLYGVLNAASQSAMFLTMPLGGWLLSRFRIGPLLLWLTLGTVAGAVLCALAVSMPMFIAGSVVRALAAGGLATVSMGAVCRGLPAKYRQLVLAGMSGVWVISSLAGPAYAVAVSAVLGWRWAMIIYLPLLLLVRLMIARQMPPRPGRGAIRDAPPWKWSLALSGGALLLAIPAGVWSVVGIIAGGLLMLRAGHALLPPGSLRGVNGRPAALSALLVTTGVYFGAVTVLSVVAHDGFGLEAHQFGFIIAAPGFVWAIFGLWSGAHPSGPRFRRRVLSGGAAVFVGVVGLLVATSLARTPGQGMIGLLIGAAVLGLGMGLIYPDLLGRCLTAPDPDDGISQDHMPAAVILAEAIGTAVITTAAYAWLGTGFGLGNDPLHRSQLLYAGLIPLGVLMLHRLFAASRRTGAPVQ